MRLRDYSRTQARFYSELWHVLWQRDASRLSTRAMLRASLANTKTQLQGYLKRWWPVSMVVGGVFLLCGPALIVSAVDDHRWQSFKVTHACKMVGYRGGDVDRESWLCDDGMTYWKEAD